MNIKGLKPVTGRDWGLIGVGALATALAVAVLFPRYEVHRLAEGMVFVRVDHWTGAMARCGDVCYPIRDWTAGNSGGASTSSQPDPAGDLQLPAPR